MGKNTRQVPAEEYRAVAALAAAYVEALQTGEAERLADVFHPDAVTYGTVDGNLVGGGEGNPTVDFIRQYGKSPHIESHIDVVDMTPTTAVVRVLLEKDAVGSDCTDTLLLLKIGTGWKVIAKVFHQY